MSREYLRVISHQLPTMALSMHVATCYFASGNIALFWNNAYALNLNTKKSEKQSGYLTSNTKYIVRTPFVVRRAWRYERGNQDGQHNGQKKKDK